MSKVSNAVRVLTTALNNDPGFYQGYQANIAMAMSDELEAFSDKKLNELPTALAEYLMDFRLRLCNAAAKRFLDMWINLKNEDIPKNDWFKEAF